MKTESTSVFSEKFTSSQGTRISIGISLFTVVIGISGIFLYALQDISQIASTTGISIMVASASLIGGVLLGFLFGIPRTLQQEHPGEPVPDAANRSEDNSHAVAYRVNTNLEQISDWLTKILVGVGLTQLTKVPGTLLALAEYVDKSLPLTNSQPFVLAVIIYFSICGFLLGYLGTRLILTGAFRQAELAVLGDQLDDVRNRFNKFEEQSNLDMLALKLVYRQLIPDPNAPEISQEEMNKAILNASPNVRVQIFSQAHYIRSKNWQYEKDKMARTIPIFRALIASDSEGRFFRNHAELGFALKDKDTPDWKNAEAELSKAITLRDKRGRGGWELYELNRAICRIHLENVEKDDIIADLRVAASNKNFKEIIQKEDVFIEWMKHNNVTLDQLS